MTAVLTSVERAPRPSPTRCDVELAVRVVVVGTTASGKSDVALAAAQAAGCEIISVDSMQVYRGMDVGTAKPTSAQRTLVPHHLIDLVDHTEPFTLADFQTALAAAAGEMGGRSMAAIAVGGTGLYQRSVVDRLDLPGQWPEIRAGLEASNDVAGMYAELVSRDPVAASRMEPSNSRRIIRALEVCRGSGRPFSSFGPGLDAYPSTGIAQVGVRWSRPALERRIEQRVLAMVERGLVEEISNLVTRGPFSATAAQALGYREMIDHLEGRVSLDEAIAAVILHTRQFAVRQDRWFRRDPRIEWVDIGSNPVDEALPVVLRLLETER